MQYFKNRIIAKSTPENFEKEKEGRKNNTVRVLDRYDINKMNIFINIDWRKFIQISNTETWEVFERVIRDITKVDLWLYKESESVEKKGFSKADIYLITFEEHK